MHRVKSSVDLPKAQGLPSYRLRRRLRWPPVIMASPEPAALPAVEAALKVDACLPVRLHLPRGAQAERVRGPV